MSTHTFQTKFFNIPASIGLNLFAHIINGYDICLKTTQYPIVNMQDFRYWMCTSTLDYFGQLVLMAGWEIGAHMMNR